MKVVGHGVDLLSHSRLMALVQRQGGPSRLLKKICNSKEREEFHDKFSVNNSSHSSSGIDSVAFHRQVRWLGVRWAMKEAVFKVFSSVVYLGHASSS